jgi:hypothetical protein
LCVPTGATGAASADVTSPGAVRPRPAQQQSADDELAAKYAPIVYTKQQDEPCDRDGEAYYPSPVEIVLGNPNVAL